MNLNRKERKNIRGLIVFAAVMILALMKFDFICQALLFLAGILKPFLIGGVIAFVINLPMSFYERKLFRTEGRKERQKKILLKIKRPVSLVLAIISVLTVIALVVVTVVPQLVNTVKVLAKEIPVFAEEVMKYLEVLLASNPALLEQISAFQIPEINWQETLQAIWNFLQSGMVSMLRSSFTVAGSIASGTVNFFIALVFSFYILIQKEKLGNQVQRTIKAYAKPSVYEWCMKVAALLYRNFSHFITGQCTEAVILGSMFMITMAIFRFPFAVMVGVLIAFTALIPIVGAFIGCFIGAFLILVDTPSKAIWFLILFIVLQQIEGNLIYPHVVGSSVGLPSIWVLAAVTIGGSLMGVAGMLIFIPLLSTVYVLLREDVNKRNGAAYEKEKRKTAGKDAGD